MKFFRKKKLAEVDRSLLREPSLSTAQRKALLTGIQLFNARKFWEAHEAWEEVWKGVPDESRIFFQGIIQAAAAYHLLLVKRRYGGMMNNFDKALSKLELFPGKFLGIDVTRLKRAIAESKGIAERLGSDRLAEFPPNGIPKL